MHLKFDANQDFQLDAIASAVALFENATQATLSAFALGDELIPNVPPDDWLPPLDEDTLLSNVQAIQANKGVPGAGPGLAVNEGPMLDLEKDIASNGKPQKVMVSAGKCRYPAFTVEMETGTGKTYVYLRTIYELRKRYGFTKFVIVVPSVAIYEGVRASFNLTHDHFSQHYDNETVKLIPYDSNQLSQVRGFATSPTVVILLITLDAFNKKSNKIYQASDKLPGERLPYQFIQDVRPILILDEPQNMESENARTALRTLSPLFALHYSATHRNLYNLIYRLTPFDAFQRRLVKRIQVWGVQERNDFNHTLLALQAVKRTGNKITATVRTYVGTGLAVKEEEVTLKPGDNLYKKTGREEHRADYTVTEITVTPPALAFNNGVILRPDDTENPHYREVFRTQIRETIQRHFATQRDVRRKGVKVLSLFFIDRVDNYVAPNGIIRTLFDELFNQLKLSEPDFRDLDPAVVRRAYFAKRNTKTGEEEFLNTDSRTESERELEKDAFNLIMREKERLLGFDEPVCFIFAHSALKEGWDNPNVFQICTLNQTVSEFKKRQEIGRGLRLCVNQNGDRLLDDDANVLTVIANDSYDRYARTLQTEYVADGMAEAPPPPANARDHKARRNDAIFHHTPEFQAFWSKLAADLRYEFRIDTEVLIAASLHRLNHGSFPVPTITIERGAFIITKFRLTLLDIQSDKARLKLTRIDTNGNETTATRQCQRGDSLAEFWRDPRLKGYLIAAITANQVQFANQEMLAIGQTVEHDTEAGQKAYESVTLAATTTYPVFNLIDRAARDTGLTRATVNRIFKGLEPAHKAKLFLNPEGFAGRFITEIKQTLADHIAETLEFLPAALQQPHPLEELFPPERAFIRVKSEQAGDRALYDWIQLDSDVERNFLARLKTDPHVVFFFKFPATFKVELPKQIGNYNPDWGLVRYDSATQQSKLYLIRETKGGTDLNTLRFPHEKRKIVCALKYFAKLGVDYDFTTGDNPDWWASRLVQQTLQQQP